MLIHGGGGQGLDWLGAPDGRPGWASYLVQEGYAVYVVDRPGHGRASLHPDVLGPMGPPFTYELARFLFMPPGSEGTAPNPTAELHTQWPRNGEIGDPALDQFLAPPARCCRTSPPRTRSNGRAGPSSWIRSARRS